MQSADQFMRNYEKTTNRHDVDAVLSLIDDDAVYLFSNESVHIGKSAIDAAIRRNFDTIRDETYSIENIVWLAESNEVAACVYDFSWTGRIDGKAVSGSGEARPF
ncbi:MAG: nuclear transport factor 2 family protein [Candidatus Poribacteria bacterium]|nr:nuclear transport factor 2 family protein [Candidatus Poribacteria bacterium]